MSTHANKQLATLLAHKAFIAMNEHGQVANDEGGVCHALLTEQEIIDLCQAAFDMGVRTGIAAVQEVRRASKSSGTYRRANSGVIELVRRKV